MLPVELTEKGKEIFQQDSLVCFHPFLLTSLCLIDYLEHPSNA